MSKVKVTGSQSAKKHILAEGNRVAEVSLQSNRSNECPLSILKLLLLPLLLLISITTDLSTFGHRRIDIETEH